jgi:Major capsid protein Gp23
MTDIVDPSLTAGMSSDEVFKKILIPMIRKTLPSMIANDIVGIQPMTGPSGSIFSMKPNYSGVNAQDVPGYDDWLRRTLRTDCQESVDIYIEELVG